MNKMQVREMMKKPWWSYALLLAGVFLFTEGTSLLYNSDAFSIQISVILFSMIMHSISLKDLSQKLFLKVGKSEEKINVDQNNTLKDKSCLIANLVTQLTLILIAVLCYFNDLNIIKIFLFDIAAIVIYFLVSTASYKINKKRV